MKGGIFGNMFDLNRDGKLDAMEQAMDFMLFDELTRQEQEDNEEESDNDEF